MTLSSRVGRAVGLVWRVRLARWLRAPLWAVATAIVAAPFVVAWRIDQPVLTTVQQDAPIAVVGQADLARWIAIGHGLPARAAPVVLAYHDIRAGSADPYVVTPSQFDRQLTALEAAGYHTCTSAELIGYLRGGALPPRSVYLTFDDGTSGIYEYADRILARHGMTAAAFLISGRVGRFRPYYVTWDQVRRLAATGRWDFEAHTHDLHSRAPVGPNRVDGSVLTGSIWLPGRRMESLTEHATRIRADLAEMFADFAAHDLPRPAVFAYPYSENDSTVDHGAFESTRAVVSGEFEVALSNKVPTPAPVSRRSATAGLVERLEVFSGTSADELLAGVVTRTQLPTRVPAPLADLARWWDDRTRSTADLTVLNGQRSTPATPTGYLSAYYAPYASADWVEYTVEADVTGLHPGNNGNLVVRAGSPAQTAVRVSCCSVQVVVAATGAVLAQHGLHLAGHHHVTVGVAAGWLDVTVDGLARLRVPEPGPQPATGGIGLAARRGWSAYWPHFLNLSVTPRQPTG
jgi:poly-beta-1,6-N-acetyl-D-glucosamine N-deacetylase